MHYLWFLPLFKQCLFFLWSSGDNITPFVGLSYN